MTTRRQRRIVMMFTDHRYTHRRKISASQLEKVWIYRNFDSPKKAAELIGIGKTTFEYWRLKMGGRPLR